MSTRTSRGRSSSTIPVVVGLVIVVGIALAFALGGGGDDGGGGGDFDLAAVPAPTIEGSAVASGQTGVPAPTVRAAALLSEGENEVPVPGEATMIVFLAHWCPACNAEVPVINQWLTEDGLPEGTEVRTVATAIDDTRPNYPPDEWLRERNWMVPTLIDPDGSIAAAYGVDSFPYWVFVDADGLVVGAANAQSQEALAEIAESLAAG